MRPPDSSEIREGTRKDRKQHEGEEGRKDSARMLSVQSDGGFPIKLQIKTHILLECQWVHGDIARVEGPANRMAGKKEDRVQVGSQRHSRN